MDTKKISGLGAAMLPFGALLSSVSGQTKPNIIYIMSDDHAFQAISAYDSSRVKTPNIDRIAKDGMRFDRCYVTNSLSGPSRACLLTGKYSHKSGFYDNYSTFNGAQQTFPKLLRAAGYQTAVVGKWHLVSDPTGFDFWDIHNGQGTYYNPQMFQGDTSGRKLNRTVTGYATSITTDMALGFLRTRNTAKPFMLMVHYKAPHRNWEPGPGKFALYQNTTFAEPPTLFDTYSCRGTPSLLQDMMIKRTMTMLDFKINNTNGALTPSAGADTAAWKAFFGARLADFNSRGWTWSNTTNVDEIRWKYQNYMRDYLACISSVDDGVGILLDSLKARGLDSNTVIIYTSDQGFYLGEHGWFDKRFMYEESFRTPLLVKYPKVTNPGSKNGDIVSNLDFAETFLNIAGVPVPADMQGRSFLPILRNQKPADWRKYLYYHYYEQDPSVHNVYRHYGITDGRYKLIYFWDIAEWEFYDLRKDPNELINQYYIPDNASRIAVMKLALDSIRTALQVPPDTIITRTKAIFTTCPSPLGTHLVVNLGSSSGYYAVGETLTVVANRPPAGQGFLTWTGDTLICGHRDSAVTMVIVPDKDVTLTATFGTVNTFENRVDGRSDRFDLRVKGSLVHYQVPVTQTASSTSIRIMLFDMKGNSIGVLAEGIKPAGSYKLQLDRAKLAAGVYCCRLTSRGYVKSVPLVIRWE